MEAERALLGAMLLSSEAAEGAAEMLSPEDFQSERHGRIFSAIRDLTDRGQVADQVTVATRFSDPKAKPYLVELVGECITASAWRGYADAVKLDASRRRLTRLGAVLSAGNYDPDEMTSQVLSELSATERGGGAKRLRSVLSGMDLTAKTAYLWSEMLPGVNLHRGDLFVVGARPSVGKSAFAAQLAEEVASRHARVRIYSYEMSAEDYARRYVHRRTGWGRAKQDDGLSEEEAAYASQCLDGDWQDFVEIDDSNPSLHQLVRQIRRFASDGGWLVIVDHAQILVRADTEAVAEASRALKLAANDSRLNRATDQRPVVCLLSQLNRGVAREDGTLRPPSMTDLKQSGALEQDADQVCLLHHFDRRRDKDVREALVKRGYVLAFDEQNGAPPYKTLSQIDVRKNRHGRLFTEPAWWDGDSQHWSYLDRLEAR